MSENPGGPLAASLDLFQEFVTRFAAGLGQRIEGDVETTPAELIPVDRESLPEDLGEGALVGRTVWAAEGEEHSGCFLWFGALGGLLGGDELAAGALEEDHVTTLDQSLRLNVEEGAEDDIALEWSPLESIPGGGLGEALREAGASASGQGARFHVRLGDTELTFLFFEAPGATAAGDAGDTEPGAVHTEATAGTPAAATAPAPAPDAGEGALPAGAEQLEHLLDLRLPLTIRLGSTRMTLDELLRLSPGAVVELDEREDAPLEVLANGRTIARGEVVVVDERFGLRITEIGTTQERLSATV